MFKRNLSESKVHLLDFHEWFREMKKKSQHPLFPKTGIHWSKYGEVLAADSIINYINTIQKKKYVPKLLISEIQISSEMRDTDDDIEDGMNLLFEIQDLQMGYPQLKIEKKSNLNQAKVLTVSDSYYWGMFNWGCSRDIFNEGKFWYYNKEIYPDSFTKSINVDDINIMEEVEKNDVIILLSTDANLYKFGFGFIDQLYDGYFNSSQNLTNIKNAN